MINQINPLEATSKRDFVKPIIEIKGVKFNFVFQKDCSTNLSLE